MTIRAPHFSTKIPAEQQPVIDFPNLLVTTLAVATLPFALYDWPQPEPVDIQQPDQRGVPLVILSPDQSVHRSPLIVPHFPATTQQPEQLPTPLALLSEAVPAGDPFYQTDWPNPTTVAGQAADQLPAPLALLFVEPAADAPFYQTDWPIPFVEPFVEADQGQIPLPIRVDAGDKPFLLSEWPEPELVPIQQPPDLGISVALATAPEAGDPFYQTEWPVPEFEDIQQPGPEFVPLVILSPDDSVHRAPLYVQHDPVPTQQPEALPTPITLISGPAPLPEIRQYDWPNPQDHELLEVQQPQDIQLSLDARLFVPPLPEIRQYDWPNPQIPEPIVQDWTHSSQIDFVPEPAAAPFSQLEWPNPVVDVDMSAQALTIVRFDSETPFKQLDWPNPQIPVTVFADQTAMPLSSLVDAGAKPFAQTEWPYPDPLWFQQPPDFQVSLDVRTFVPPDFNIAKLDWPNPIEPEPIVQFHIHSTPVDFIPEAVIEEVITSGGGHDRTDTFTLRGTKLKDILDDDERVIMLVIEQWLKRRS